MPHSVTTAHPWEECGPRVLDDIGEGFFTLDHEWRFAFVSREAEKVLRAQSSELLGEIFWTKFPTFRGTDFEKVFQQAETQQRPSTVISFDSGHGRWYEVSSYPAPNGIDVYIRDITEPKRIETERARLIEEGDRQRRMYETALCNTADFNYVFDLEGRLIYANPALLRLWEKPLNAVLGRKLSELNYPPDVAAHIEQQVQQVVASGQVLRDESSYTRGSETRDYEYILVPVFNKRHQVEAVSGSTRDITDRKRLEAAAKLQVSQLRTEQERLAGVFHQTPCFMCVLRGPDHVIELANDRFCDLLGQQDLVGRKLLDMIPELRNQIFPGLLDQVYQTGIEYIGKETSVMLQRDPGRASEKRYVDFVYQPLRDAARAVTGILLFGVDLTEHKRAEEELKAEEEHYRHAALESASAAEANAKFRVFFEQGAQFASVLSPDGTVIEANRLCLKACGFTCDDVLKRPFWECGWWDPSPALQAMVRGGVQEAASGKIFRRETEYFTADGNMRTVDLLLAPVTNGGGRVLFVAATGTDITERKRVETALRQSEARIRRIADSAPVLIWETDLDGLTFANQSYQDFFGRSFDELKGMGWVNFLHPDDLQAAMEVYKEVYARPVARDVQLRLRRHDGEYRWLLSSGFPHFDEEGKFVGFVGSSSDVTGLKQSEETQRHLADELSRADRQKDAFLALLAHELRNPLAPLLSGIEMLELTPNDPAALEHARTMMARQLRHMVRLIDDLLDVSRIATNKVQVRQSRVALAEIVATAVETARPVITAASHELAVSLPAEPVTLYADLTRMAQVISNLLINSAKYTPPGGNISVTGRVRGDRVLIEVKDDGIGIPRESLASIFNLFTQVDQSIERSTGGLGIGLALVKGLVELHGGTVVAESPGPNAGSTFTVTLPLLATSEAPSQGGSRTTVVRITPKHRILVVDDHPDAALGMAAVLKRRGHQVAVAHNGASAIRTAESSQPDVILMDIGMPGMNGYDTTRKIRATDWGRSIFIIAVTGWGQETDRAHSQEAGCNAHLVKPVHLPELEELLTRVPSALT
jgi:PAS domain S-box-containing protein